MYKNNVTNINNIDTFTKYKINRATSIYGKEASMQNCLNKQQKKIIQEKKKGIKQANWQLLYQNVTFIQQQHFMWFRGKHKPNVIQLLFSQYYTKKLERLA